jgi:hypothetical protein
MTKCVALAVAALLPLLATRTSRADSTICREGSLVETGQRVYEVLAHCGNPSWSQRYDAASPRGLHTWVEEWVYDLGRGSFPRFLRFENGVLVGIVVLSRPG